MYTHIITGAHVAVYHGTNSVILVRILAIWLSLCWLVRLSCKRIEILTSEKILDFALSGSDVSCASFNSSWPSATYMRRDFQCLFPQRPGYGALISVLISPVPHTWGVTNGSLLASPPNSRRSPASLISPAPHICGASRTPIPTRVVWKILNVVTNILVVLPDYRLP